MPTKTKAKAKPHLCATSRKVIKEARKQAAQSGQDQVLAEHAAMIRRLGKRVIADIIEIGRRLSEAKPLVGHGHWEAWLETEFGWSADTALNFMRVYELSENYKSRKFRDLMIAPSALYFLAKPSTPETVRTNIIERADAGETITVNTVRAATEQSGTNTPALANEAEASPLTQNNTRWFRQTCDCAHDAIRAAQMVNSVIEPELAKALREVIQPGLLPTIKRGGQALIDLANFLESLLQEEPQALAQAAE